MPVNNLPFAFHSPGWNRVEDGSGVYGVFALDHLPTDDAGLAQFQADAEAAAAAFLGVPKTEFQGGLTAGSFGGDVFVGYFGPPEPEA